MAAMDPYDGALAPAAFGQHNTGASCYFNSLLQVLAGCTAFSREVLRSADYLRRTTTGAAVVGFVAAYAALAPGGTAAARAQPADDIATRASAVLDALRRDLAARRPNVRFGGGQESASEALVHLLDMMEPAPTAAEGAAPVESSITNLFLHRVCCDVYCGKCNDKVSKRVDYAVTFDLFHLDRLRDRPATPDEFSRAVRAQVSTAEDYRCPACPCATCGARPVEGKCPTCGTAAPVAKAVRVYNLTMVPEIVICTFNIYRDVRCERYFPERFELPARDGGWLVFRLVGQVEHRGGLGGGHYWARGLRAGAQVYRLDDAGVSPAAFDPTRATYVAAYHYEGRRTGALRDA